MNSSLALDKIIEIINNSKKIGIFAHESPDGDAIGSSLAFYNGLLNLGYDVSVISDKFASCFNFLEGSKNVLSTSNETYDLCLVLDCADKSRVYDPGNCLDHAKYVCVIDHHASNTFFGDYNYVEDKSPAVCKTLIKVFSRLSITITREIGEAMIAGIITDSGGFRYDSVDDETFEFAAHLLDLGVNISDIYSRCFDVKTMPQFKLTKIAIERLKFYHKGSIAVTYITDNDFKKAHANIGDHEGIVNIGLNVEGVKISIFVREVIDNKNKNIYKISLRGYGDIDVSEMASTFGGGGHIKASGCVINDNNMENVIKKLIKEAKKII